MLYLFLQITDQQITCIYDIIGLLFQEAQSLTLFHNSRLNSSACSQGMTSSRLFITLDQLVIPAVHKKDLIVISFISDGFQNIPQHIQMVSAADINSQCHFGHHIFFMPTDFCKFQDQWYRKIINTKIACIFKHLQYRTLSCS